MNNLMPCITDSDEHRFEPDAPEEDDPRTDMEKRIEWICSEWRDAITDDTYDTWRDVRMMIFGAKQAINQCTWRSDWDAYKALDTLGDMAFENGLECLKANKYEGAPQ